MRRGKLVPRLFPKLAGILGPSSVVAVVGLFSGAGLILNQTASLPLGLYRQVKKPVARGRLVAVCLPRPLGELAVRRHYLPSRWALFACPGSAGPALKIVAAMGGDTVTVRQDGLRVNGAVFDRWDLYTPATDHPVDVPTTFRLEADELWLHGLHSRSWDSRHYGPVPHDDRATVIEPVWIEEPQRLDQFLKAIGSRPPGESR